MRGDDEKLNVLTMVPQKGDVHWFSLMREVGQKSPIKGTHFHGHRKRDYGNVSLSHQV